MAIHNNPPKKEEKPGLLAIQTKEGEPLFKEGDPIPLLEKAGIPSRVDEKGRVEWQPTPLDILNIVNRADLLSYMHHRNTRFFQMFARNFNAMIRAHDGMHVAVDRGGWPIEQMPAIQLVHQWQEVPEQIKAMVVESLKEYLSPQLKKSNA